MKHRGGVVAYRRALFKKSVCTSCGSLAICSMVWVPNAAYTAAPLIDTDLAYRARKKTLPRYDKKCMMDVFSLYNAAR